MNSRKLTSYFFKAPLKILTLHFLQAFLIAFTSNFLPRLLYRYNISKDGSLTGYLNYSLAWAPPNTTKLPCRFVCCYTFTCYLLPVAFTIAIITFLARLSQLSSNAMRDGCQIPLSSMLLEVTPCSSSKSFKGNLH